jgi:trigger factor
LQTSVEHLEGNKIRLTVTVPAEEVDREVAAAYTHYAEKLRIPGFRPGKAPRPVIDTHVGRETVLAEAQESIVADSYARAISEEDLRTYGQPDVGELDLVEPGKDYTYTAEVDLRPELTLSGTADLTVTVSPQRASDREVDAQIEYTRERFSTLEVTESAVGPSDFALISFVGTVDGEPYEGNTVDKFLYEMGRGLMPTEFDEALTGATPGTSVVAEFAIPDTSSNPEFVGKQARFEIDVHEVKTKVPPALDDDFAASVGGFDTFDEYRDDVRAKLDGSKAAGHARRVEMLRRAALAERLEGEIPEEMIENRTASMTREFFEGLEERGFTLQEYVQATGVMPEQIQADIREQAAVRVREELALEALFRAEGLVVTEDDISEAMLEIAGGNPDAAIDLRARLEENGAMPILREEIMHKKAAEWLEAHVVVVEEEPEAEDAPAEQGTKKRAAKPVSKAKAPKKTKKTEKEQS